MNLKLLKEERSKLGYTQKYMAQQLGFKDRSSYCLSKKERYLWTLKWPTGSATILHLSKEKTFEIFFASIVQETSTEFNCKQVER